MLKSQLWALTRPRFLPHIQAPCQREQGVVGHVVLLRGLLVDRPSRFVEGSGAVCASTRGFHSGSNLARVEQRSSDLTLPTGLPDHVLRNATKQPSPPRIPQSRIRRSLRAWADQNERTKSESIPDTFAYEGKVTQLPNSLFVGEGGKNTKEDEGEATERDVFHDGDGDVYGDPLVGDLIRPGTLMTHRSMTLPRQTIVYLGDIGTQSLIFLGNGNWAATKLTQKRVGYSKQHFITVPNFLSRDEVDGLLAHMPKQDVRRSAGEGLPAACIEVVGQLPDHVLAPVLAKMNAFQAEVKSFSRDHRYQLGRTYDLLAQEDTWRRMRLRELPPLILGMSLDDMSDAAKLCFVSHIVGFHPLIVTFQTAGTLQLLIGPKTLNETIETVSHWARLYQEAAAQAAAGKNVAHLLYDNPLSSFIDKARRIILRSRKVRPLTGLGFIGPSLASDRGLIPQKIDIGEALTNDDKKIVAYLWDAAVRLPVTMMSLAQSAMIVRAVGAYPDTALDKNTIRLFLHELGCMNPWDRDYDLTSTSTGGVALQLLAKLQDEAQQALEQDWGSTAVSLPDSMAGQRKDWADLEVFCIDPDATTNSEDAFSIEPASELEGGHWFHTHIAHPTAHITPDHPVARFARARGATDYVRDGVTLPQFMVPQPVMDRFTLTPGAPVLTISTLLDADCSVKDVKVVPAYINNIVRLSPASVRHALGIAEPEEAVLVVGKVAQTQDPRISKRPASEVSDMHRLKLSLMHKVLVGRVDRRKQEVEVPAEVQGLQTLRLVQAALPEVVSYGRHSESYHWRGDPGFVISSPRRVNVKGQMNQRFMDDIVSQGSHLTSESIGKWLHDREIPAIFRGYSVPEGFSMEKLNEAGVYGSAMLPSYTRTSSARPSYFLNIKQSAMCTSPLRNFTDMVNLFQIDSYLKAQAQGVLQPDAVVTDDSILAFSKADIDEYLLEDSSALDIRTNIMQKRESRWVLQALYRAFHCKEANLPEVFEVIVETPGHRDADGQYQDPTGLMVPWFPLARIEPSPQGFEKSARPQQVLPVKILRVDYLLHEVVVQAVGPPTDEQQIFDEIRCYTEDNFKKEPTIPLRLVRN